MIPAWVRDGLDPDEMAAIVAILAGLAVTARWAWHRMVASVRWRDDVRETVEAAKKAAQQAAYNTKPNGGSSSHDQIMRRLDRIEDVGHRNTQALSHLQGQLTGHISESKAWVQAAKTVDPTTPDWPTTQGDSAHG